MEEIEFFSQGYPTIKYTGEKNLRHSLWRVPSQWTLR